MDERNNIWTSVTLMALVGGTLTALLFTERGRQSLMHFEQALDDFGRSLRQLRSAVQKAGMVATQGIEVATEGKEVVSGLIGRSERRSGPTVTH
jgi:hypothetical protein